MSTTTLLRDLAVSHYNAGSLLEALQDRAGANLEFAKALPIAQQTDRTLKDSPQEWAALRAKVAALLNDLQSRVAPKR